MFLMRAWIFSLAVSISGLALADEPLSSSRDGDVQIEALALVSNATLLSAAPTLAEAQARLNQPWLNQIKKPFANQLGTGNGQGVTIGLVDTGVQTTHPELLGRVIAGYNAFTGGTDITDQMGHGTHVAGILVGSLVNGSPDEGLASGANLAVAKVFQTGSSSVATVAKGIDWEVNVQRVPILSLSLGISSVSLTTNIKNAVTNGTLVVAAAGNDGSKTKLSWPAMFAKESWAMGQIIAVGALDSNNKRASFSNYASSLANWMVYAPGVSITSSYSLPTSPNQYAAMSGTSMATPMVAGQAALIKSNWNFLSANNLAQIIFQSATHLCSDTAVANVCLARTAPDSMYGWGLINVGASLQPIGSLNVLTKTGQAVALGNTLFASSKAGSGTVVSSINTLGVDKFNRGFVINIPVAGASPTSPTAGVGPASVMVTPTTILKVGLASFTAEYDTVNSRSLGFAMPQGEDHSLQLTRMSFVQHTSDGVGAVGFGMGSTVGSFMGLQASGLAPLTLSDNQGRFNAPYFGFLQNGVHTAYGFGLQDGTQVRVAYISQLNTLSNPMESNLGVNRQMVALDLQRKFGATTGVVTLGSLQEDKSLLGAFGSGAMGLSGNAQTTFLTVAASHNWSQDVRLAAMATTGYTSGLTGSGESLVDGASGIQTLAWSFGVSKSDLYRLGDRVGLTVAMPLRTLSGGLQMTTATAQSQQDGSLQYTTQTLNMAPSGVQTDLELAYTTPLRAGGVLSAMAIANFQPGHDANAPTRLGLGARYHLRF
jgi:Subtilase family